MSYVDIIADLNPEAYVMDDYDDCIIGISNTGVLVYSKLKIITKLILEQEMPLEDAEEWYSYNMVRALDYLGPTAPIFCEEYECTEL